MEYDVAIVGASFAGLSVASKLKGSVLLIDRKDVGSHQTSACGTPVKTMEGVGCENSILQEFDTAAIHVGDKEIDIPLSDRYCTIDYRRFCETLFRQSSADFVKASASGVRDGKIITDRGDFRAKIIVDCSGWPAVLAKSMDESYVKSGMMSFGIETEIPYKRDDKLRFFVDRRIIGNGAAWLFPCGGSARFGVASYAGDTKLLPALEKFVGSCNLMVGKVHGGFFCHSFKMPCVGNIFAVGCAAGQTLPLSGEGIRGAIVFGLMCGEILQQIVDGKISMRGGMRAYENLALRHKRKCESLLRMQEELPRTSLWKIRLMAEMLSLRPVGKYVQGWYEKI